MKKDATLHGDFGRHTTMSDLCISFRDDFVDWLGEDEVHAWTDHDPTITVLEHEYKWSLGILPVPLRCWFDGSSSTIL